MVHFFTKRLNLWTNPKNMCIVCGVRSTLPPACRQGSVIIFYLIRINKLFIIMFAVSCFRFPHRNKCLKTLNITFTPLSKTNKTGPNLCSTGGDFPIMHLDRVFHESLSASVTQTNWSTVNSSETILMIHESFWVTFEENMSDQTRRHLHCLLTRWSIGWLR